MNKEAVKEFHKLTPAAKNSGATIIDLSSDPDDFSPAINHIVTSIQGARAANQKIIIMLGEEHLTISNVAFAQLLRLGLEKSGNKERPALAVEQNHKLLEFFLPYPFKAEPSSIIDAAKHTLQNISKYALLSLFSAKILPLRNADRYVQSLQNLKHSNSERYYDLQALALASQKWPQAPVTRLESVSSWLRQKLPVRLVDLSKTMTGHIDINDLETAEFIKANFQGKNTAIKTLSTDGIRLRNLWMLAKMREISNDHDVVIFQTGNSHITGNNKEFPYEITFSGLSMQSDSKVKVITVLQEHTIGKFEKTLSPEALLAIQNPDTIIIRGGNIKKHWRTNLGSFEDEIATLHKIFNASGFTDNELCQDKEGYERKRLEMQTTLLSSLEQSFD